MNDTQTVSGTVWAIFGHRFAIEGGACRVLADLGPGGAEGLALAVGDAVTVAGERKPTEIKVTAITLADGTVRTFARPKKPHDRKDAQGEEGHGEGGHGPADPAAALAAVRAGGYAVEGEPRRRPKHFEIVAVRDGTRHELHVALDGTIRKAKPLAA